MNKFLITESEKNNIRKMYNFTTHNDYIIESPHLTIDGRFLIYNDELLDLNLNENLGDLFTLKNLKHLFENINMSLLNEQYYIIENVKNLLNKTNEKYLKEEIRKSIKDGVLLEQNDTIGSVVGNSILWVARKVKNLLWSIGGMAADAFLVASGIGKSVQWIPWFICFCLDVYEWINNDYEKDEDRNASPAWKILNLGFDILGFMTTGPFATIAKTALEPL